MSRRRRKERKAVGEGTPESETPPKKKRKHHPLRWLGGRLRAIGRWFMSKRGRNIWLRVLLFGVCIPLAPYAVAVWRVILYGEGSEQCFVFIALMAIILIRGGVKKGRTLKAERKKEEEKPKE